ncbi:MAG: ABC transporter permease [Ruminococcus sp.]
MKWKYILKRILIAIPTFFGITILAYFILNMAPGSPLDALLADPGITPAELERKRVALGLDQPVIIQYFTWLKQLLTGNLGFSYSTQRPVAAMILERLPATAILAASSIVLSLIVSIPLGIFAASRPNSGRDYFSGGLSMLMMATPNFFVGLVFIYLFAIVFNILPSGGMYSSSGAHTFGDLMKHMILPCLVLSFQQIGGWVRHMRKQYAGSHAG